MNGVNRNNNITKVDGAASIFIWLPHHAQYISPAETVETVNVSTNNFDAEQGMAGGAAITVQTKSGTNEFHGSAFALHDNQRLRAKNFFSPGEKPRSTKNIDGFTLGGPIVKNKVFFFGGLERYSERLGYQQTSMTVATADQRAGDFSAYTDTTLYDPATGNADGTGRIAFANNVIPMARQSPIIRQLQDLVPMPNRPGVIGNLSRSGTQRLDRTNIDSKFNWNKSDSLSIWGKYSTRGATFACDAALGAAQGQGLCSGAAGRNVTRDQTSTIGWSKTFAANFLWDATIGWTRHGNNSGDFVGFGTNFGLDVLGIPGTNGPDPRQSGIPRFSISGYETLGNPNGWQPNYYGDTTFTIDQNFSYIKNQHNIRFGFQGLRHHLNHWQPEIGGGPRGRFDFGNGVTGLNGGPSLTQYNAYSSFLLGLPSYMGKSLQYEKMSAFNLQLGLYVRDRWQVNQKLTLTLGLRWEKYPMMTRGGRGGIEWWNPDTNIVSLGGAGGNPKDLGISTSNKMFAPRIGLAYKLTDKTVIRSGYGITYNPMPLARPLRGFFPLTIAQDFPAANGFAYVNPISEGIPEFSGPDPNEGEVPLPPNAINRSISGKQLNRGYVQSWNFIVESQLPGKFIGSVGYVGTATVRSFGDLNINYATPGTGQAGRLFYGPYGRVADTLAWNGSYSTNYHSLQATLNRRVASGLTVKGAYTYGAAINQTDDDGWAGVSWNDPAQFSRNRARAGFDQNHIFQMGFVYDLPFGKGKSMATDGLASYILGDWQINGVFAAVQGRRFTVGASGASLNAPGNSQTADQVKPEVEHIGAIGPGSYYYDPTAFAPVNEVRYGTSGRNIMRAPGAVNLDFSLFRRFPIKERLVLEFRAESYNFTNTPHFNSPGSSVNSASFMQVLSAVQDQRQFRFGLRLQW
ncbi:MAG: TonB-dependent receptor [Bryobacterales bacterium]